MKSSLSTAIIAIGALILLLSQPEAAVGLLRGEKSGISLFEEGGPDSSIVLVFAIAMIVYGIFSYRPMRTLERLEKKRETEELTIEEIEKGTGAAYWIIILGIGIPLLFIFWGVSL